MLSLESSQKGMSDSGGYGDGDGDGDGDVTNDGICGKGDAEIAFDEVLYMICDDACLSAATDKTKAVFQLNIISTLSLNR